MSAPWCHRFKSNNPPPTAGDGLPQLHSSDQAPSELPAEAEASRLVNKKEELDGGSLQKCSSRMKASFVSHLEIKDLECGDYQERRINQAAPNPVSSFPSLSWSGKRWRLVVLDNSVFLKSNVNAEVYQQVLEYFMLPPGEAIFGCVVSRFSKTWRRSQC